MTLAYSVIDRTAPLFDALYLHACVAGVLCMSGSGEVIKKIMRKDVDVDHLLAEISHKLQELNDQDAMYGTKCGGFHEWYSRLQFFCQKPKLVPSSLYLVDQWESSLCGVPQANHDSIRTCLVDYL